MVKFSKKEKITIRYFQDISILNKKKALKEGYAGIVGTMKGINIIGKKKGKVLIKEVM